jgi:ATP-binding cassette subfamily B protein
VAEIGSLVSEVLGATRIVQAFNQERLEADRFTDTVERTFTAAKRRIVIRSAMTSTVIFLVFGALNLLMWRGALGVARHEITGGTIAAFVLTGGVVAGAFGSLSEVYGDLVRAAGAASRLSELLNEKPAIAAPARPLPLPVPARGSLSFEGVTFRYPTRPDVVALGDFTLKVEPGETVAIVGPSGAGKSTIFQLAERFYDPHAGTIKLDGVPLTGADPAEIAAASRWSRRRVCCLPPARGIICAMVTGTPRMSRSGMRPARPMPNRSCAPCRMVSTPSLAKTAPACRVASVSALPLPAPCCARRRSCCWTRPPVLSTPRASGWCRKRSTA